MQLSPFELLVLLLKKPFLFSVTNSSFFLFLGGGSNFHQKPQLVFLTKKKPKENNKPHKLIATADYA